MRHRRWTDVEARGVLEALRRSKLSVEQFAQQRGLRAKRLYRWRRALALADGVHDTPKLMPVHVTSDVRRVEPVTVVLRTGHVVKVAHGFDEQAFTRVVALLEGT